MYLGTVAGRMVDMYSIRQIFSGQTDSEWLPPQLTAVHYALSGSFAARANGINHFILRQCSVAVSKALTAAAMVVEIRRAYG